MSNFVESLKRLYIAGSITDDKLIELKTNGKLTEDEYAYIIAEQPSTNELEEYYTMTQAILPQGE